MKSKLALVSITLALSLASLGGQAVAQSAFSADTASSAAVSSPTRTDRSIAYHNGGVLTGTQYVYLIWYGDWSTNISQRIVLSDFMSSLGSTPYFEINQGYPDSSGQAPSGALTYGGSANDAYSHSATLTEADVADVVVTAFHTGELVLDPAGIYVVLTS